MKHGRHNRPKPTPAPKKTMLNEKEPSSSPPSGLNDKQAAFLDYYLASNSIIQSAVSAGYSKKTAYSIGSRLLKNVKIAAAIRAHRDRMQERVEISVERVLQELACMAFANMADYMSPGDDGEPVFDLNNLTRTQMAALQEVTIEEFIDGRSDKRRVRRIKFKLADKHSSLESLGRHLGLFKDDNKLGKHALMGALLDEIESERRETQTIEHQP